MAKVIEFPADKIKKGVHSHTPEMGQRKVNCQLNATLGHSGRHYYIDTPLELKGRGITNLGKYTSNRLTARGQYKVGWNEYKVTENAFDKLKKEYSVSMEMLLD